MVNIMKKRITALCSVMIVLSICVAIFGATTTDMKNDVTTATIKNYYAPKAEATTSSGLNGIVNDVLGSLGSSSSSGSIDSVIGSIEGVSGDIDSAIGSFGDSMDMLGGLGDSFGGIGDSLGGIGSSLGDAFGGVFGGLGGTGSSSAGNTAATAQTTSADVGLIIPVPAATQATTVAATAPSVSESLSTGETVDYAATSNPYTKPSATFAAGDEDETIKWLQWIFVYTGYGLKDNGITGILDEDTVAVVKKLQHENKLTVDGNITEEVVKAAEVLYYQSLLGEDVSAIEIASDATTGENASNQGVATDNGNGIPVALLIIVLVIIWVLAIGGIVLLFVFKKKKMSVAKKQEAEKAEAKEENKEENKNTEISSLSDLFEEAEKKDK